MELKMFSKEENVPQLLARVYPQKDGTLRVLSGYKFKGDTRWTVMDKFERRPDTLLNNTLWYWLDKPTVEKEFGKMASKKEDTGIPGIAEPIVKNILSILNQVSSPEEATLEQMRRRVRALGKYISLVLKDADLEISSKTLTDLFEQSSLYRQLSKETRESLSDAFRDAVVKSYWTFG